MNTLEQLRNFMNIWFTDVISKSYILFLNFIKNIYIFKNKEYATMYKDSIL